MAYNDDHEAAEMELESGEPSEEAQLTVLEHIKELMDQLEEKKLGNDMSLVLKKKMAATDAVEDKAEGEDEEEESDEDKLKAISKG